LTAASLALRSAWRLATTSLLCCSNGSMIKGVFGVGDGSADYDGEGEKMTQCGAGCRDGGWLTGVTNFCILGALV
jgi:hypothetical protein